MGAPMGDPCVDALGVSRQDGCYGYDACGAGASALRICTCRDGMLVDCGACADVESGERAEPPSTREPAYCGGATRVDAGRAIDAGNLLDSGPPVPIDCTASTGDRVREGECGWSGDPAEDGLFCRCASGRFDCADRSCGDGPALTRTSAASLPLRRELEELALVADDRVFVSNNPETVVSAGILASTMPIAPGAVRSTIEGAPVPTVEGSAALDASCPNGTVRELDVYIAHIGADYDFGVGVVPASGDITVSVEGELASGEWDTRSPEFVSARVMRDFYSGSPPTRRVSAACDASSGVCRRYTEVDWASGAVARASDGRLVGAYVDGRLRLSSSGCFAIYVLARARGTAAPTRVPSAWASGNTAWPGWYGGRGAGRSAGVYGGGELAASADAPFNAAGQSRGYVVGLETTAQRAVMRLTDSASVNFGDYGGRYDLRFRVRNASRDCLRARSELVSYASVGADQRPTFTVYYPSYSRDPVRFPTVFWNSYLERSGGREGTVSARMALHVPTPMTDRPDVVPQMRSAQHVEQLGSGESRELRLRVQVPGLITAPLAIVLSTEACR